MAIGEEWTEWHLTPQGWERGTEKCDTGRRIERESPASRVLTYRYSTWLNSRLRAEESVETIWDSLDKAKRDALLQQYGECPRSL